MRVKKILCLLLAMLMLLSFTACGGDTGNDDEGGSKTPNQDPETPTSSTGEPEDNTVWVLVQEYDMGSSRNTKYIYDENGNLIGGEFFDGSEKYGDYQFVTTTTENGGKIVEEFYKHIKDSEFAKNFDYEYDAAGRLIHVTSYDYRGNPSGLEYSFTYNEAGQLVEQTILDEGEAREKLTFVYDGDKLMEGHYWDKNGNYGHYLYAYDENGVPAKVDVDSYLGQEQKYTLDFVKEERAHWWQLKATEDCHNVVGGRRLFYYEEDYEGGKPCRRMIEAKSWGIFHTGWLPLTAFGCKNVSNCFGSVTKLFYEPLDVHLAKQEAAK